MSVAWAVSLIAPRSTLRFRLHRALCYFSTENGGSHAFEMCSDLFPSCSEFLSCSVARLGYVLHRHSEEAWIPHSSRLPKRNQNTPAFSCQSVKSCDSNFKSTSLSSLNFWKSALTLLSYATVKIIYLNLYYWSWIKNFLSATWRCNMLYTEFRLISFRSFARCCFCLRRFAQKNWVRSLTTRLWALSKIFAPSAKISSRDSWKGWIAHPGRGSSKLCTDWLVCVAAITNKSGDVLKRCFGDTH